MGLEGPGEFARQGRLRRSLVFEQTDGVMNVEAVRSSQGAWGGSGCERSRRWTSRTELLVMALAV
jgi:hypothetical protein